MKNVISLLVSVIFMASTAVAGQKDFIQFLLTKKKATSVEFIAHHNEDLAISKAKNLIAKHKNTKIEPELRHRVACLLYTSPSPRDATLSRMPSSA